MRKLLVIDDEPNIVFSFKSTLASSQLTVISASTAREGIELVKTQRPDVVMLDVRLPDLTGLQAYERIRQLDERLPVIVMTAFAKTETAIEAMRLGAFEYLVKPVDLGRLRETVNKALEVSRLNRVPALLEAKETDDLTADHIVGNSPVMQDVYKGIGRIAPQESTVLILGESGTGKELVARAIYHYSLRNLKPFLAINCAALPESLLESELFGHERGAFTGADQRRIGKFEQVNGGTIFLDEIGDMSPATQAKALRLLQEQQFERIGGNITVKTDVRIIAATNRDLNQLVAEGRFRQDLLYRLNGFTIHLPPLRERADDIPILAEHFLKLFNQDLSKSIIGVSPEVMTILQAHDWPGNVREFQSAIKYAMVHATGGVLTPDCLPQSCFSHSSPTIAPVISMPAVIVPGLTSPTKPSIPEFDLMEYVRQLLNDDKPDLYRVITQEVDRLVLQEVMAHFDGSQLQASERLGISRMTLRSKLRSLGLIQEKSTEAGET
ncbi:sigma-54-dependent transcriptional regulator [Schlesneria paludicola]|uniref:sigma-54-dependent transcriptional regulator n=1 Tax=Schlesneria paludicola TaxID=360056 RepID=UPI00029A6EFA|nr:sigma-54 dependent transcriptional regulator [Schlesneria paludicola]